MRRHLSMMRFTPARAGNTLRRHGRYADIPGSPPLARGTRHQERHGLLAFRFTPARAGNTPAISLSMPRVAVHPRSRGEHQEARHFPAPVAGSPPLARGTPLPQVRRNLWVRFTPARAGNTQRPEAGRSNPPVHPRSRGEHACERAEITGLRGSPPLARGTRTLWRFNIDLNRFTPARAGNTLGKNLNKSSHYAILDAAPKSV